MDEDLNPIVAIKSTSGKEITGQCNFSDRKTFLG